MRHRIITTTTIITTTIIIIIIREKTPGTHEIFYTEGGIKKTRNTSRMEGKKDGHKDYKHLLKKHH